MSGTADKTKQTPDPPTGKMGINSMKKPQAGGGDRRGRKGGERAGPGAGRQKDVPGPGSHSRGSFSAVCFGGSLSSSKSQEEEGHPLSCNFQVHELMFEVQGRGSGFAASESRPGPQTWSEMWPPAWPHGAVVPGLKEATEERGQAPPHG